MNELGRSATALRSVEAAALAGLGHAAISLVARGLLLGAPAPDDPALGEWYASASNQRAMVTSLNLVAIGCIAFLWFGTLQTTQSVSGWHAAGFAALTIVAIRVEAVFILAATTVARLSDAFPRVVVIGGYVAGLVLLRRHCPARHWR